MSKVIIPLLIYVAIMAITPGPNNLTCLFLGARYGKGGAKKFIFGSMITLFAKGMMCGFLNLLLANIMPVIMTYLKWFGAAYMLYLAYLMARSGWEEGSKAKQSNGDFKDGVLLQFLNAKSYIGVISMFSVYIIPVSTSVWAILAGAAIFVLFCWIASEIWALCGTALSKFIEKYKKPFGLLMAAGLVYCAVSAVL